MKIKGRKPNTIIVIFIVMVILFLSVGYAAFVSTFSITNTVVNFKTDANTRVVGVTTSSNYITNLEYSNSKLNNISQIHTTANIPSGASVTFQTTITTFGNVPMALSSISVMNGTTVINNVSVSPTLNSNTYVKICGTNYACILDLNASKVVNIEITNNTGGSITTANLNINLTFTPFYTVTYNNSIIGDVLSGGTFTYTFASNTPNSITVDSGTCGTPSISNDVLTIANVTSDLVLTGSTSTGGGSGTQQDPYINDSNEYDISDIEDGYTLFEDAPGEPKINATVTTDGNGVTKTTINSFEFTDPGTNGVPFGTGQNDNDTLDTGVLAFNGNNSAFSIHIKFKTNLKANRAKYVLSALEQTGTNTYSGFSLNVADSSTTNLNVTTYINKSYSGDRISPSSDNIANTTDDANSNTENTYELTMVYNSANGGQPFVTTCTGSNCRTTTLNIHKKYIPTNLTNAKITIGGNGINSTNDIGSMKVLELHICKGSFGTNYSCNMN